MRNRSPGAISALRLACVLVGPALAFADEIQIPASKDNTLYQSDQGSLSNALGQHFFVGVTRDGNVRRAVIAFDIAGNIPAGSVINDATLTLRLSRGRPLNAITIDLRPALSDWGEGTSMALLEEGRGAASTPGDATWLHRFWDTDSWAAPGGDFSPDASASSIVSFAPTTATWNSPQMIADVQGWLDSPETNFGRD
jgi:hypothetical protein